jgi:two-component system sensor histidine kinase/response regulator
MTYGEATRPEGHLAPALDERRGSVLAVDDRPENLRLLVDGLIARGFEVRVAPSGEFALAAVAASLPDVILLDASMPGMDGYEVCARLKANERTREVPVIFVSALNDVADKVRGFDAGAVDFVTKPFQLEEVEARIRTHIELRRTRGELATSYSRLRELERLRDELTRLIVHDMRSPLSALLGSLQMLRRTLVTAARGEELEDVDLALRGGAGLLRMVNDLLEVSRLESALFPLTRGRCDLLAIARGAVAQLRGLARARVIEVTGPELWGDWDEELLRRVIENMVANAFKFSPSDRPIHVTIDGDGDPTVRVRDEGPGVPPAILGRVFDKFITADAGSGGRIRSAGLGLHFCKLAIEAHGGRVGVVSEPGKGSTFWFSLPRVTTAAQLPG